MMLFNKIKRTRFLLVVVSLVVGTVSSTIFSQIIWTINLSYELNSYSTNLIKHSESVATEIVEALKEIDAQNYKPCTPSDMSMLRKLNFNYRYLKDLGRIQDRKIKCSAIWGSFEATNLIIGGYHPEPSPQDFMIGVIKYLPTGTDVDISFNKNSFVIASPAAFSAFQKTSSEISSVIMLPDEKKIRRTFGPEYKNSGNIFYVNYRKCSNEFEICIKSQVDTFILKARNRNALYATAIFGLFLSWQFWIIVKRRVDRMQSLPVKLKQAIKEKNINVLFQPIINVSNGNVIGLESLARWSDSDLGEIRPDVFVRVAMEKNLISDLNFLIIEKSLALSKNFLRENPHVYISINLDTGSLIDGVTFSYLQSQAIGHGVNFSQIAIEVLESTTSELNLLREITAKLRGLALKFFLMTLGRVIPDWRI